MSVVPNKPNTRDPYATLGLDHDATPSQIKLKYRKLALHYHPDRQTQSQQSSDDQQEKTNKFVEIAAAYAVLSDPEKKKEYDHLYKFGAFDLPNDDEAKYKSSNNASSMNYNYTENYSGGYYTKTQANNATSTPGTQAAAPFYRSMSSASNDSFFDDLLYSPKSNKNKVFNGTSTPIGDAADKNCPARRKPGIGFSFAPLGKHLSIHVPTRNEIVMGMARGERLHNFGTRVTFSTHKVESSSSDEVQRNCSPFLCVESGETSKTFVSTTTRIARGRHRVVKRTATLRPDGKKEVVIEEDGVVRRRYIEDIKESNNPSCQHYSDSSAHNNIQPGTDLNSSGRGDKENGRWYSNILRGVQGVGRLCFAPCGPVLATVPEHDV